MSAEATCPNGPDEYGNWPCDPDPHGDRTATCAVCGWRGRFISICDHKVSDRIGWHQGVPVYECRKRLDGTEA